MHCTQRKADCSQSSAWELCGHGSCVPSADDAGYRCICEPGWKTNGLTPICGEDVDECSDSAAHKPCSTSCINLPGSFTCAPCPAGLTGNGVSCRDLDECQTNNGGCSLSPKVDCINTYGSYHCGECPVGWTGDGRKCERSPQDIDIPAGQTPRTCPAGNNPCYPTASCFLISGTTSCRCPMGMVGTGYGPNGCVNGTTTNCKENPCLVSCCLGILLSTHYNAHFECSIRMVAFACSPDPRIIPACVQLASVRPSVSHSRVLAISIHARMEDVAVPPPVGIYSSASVYLATGDDFARRASAAAMEC